VKFERMQAEHRLQIRHFHHPGRPAGSPPP
jgi:hypothetical protein